MLASDIDEHLWSVVGGGYKYKHKHRYKQTCNHINIYLIAYMVYSIIKFNIVDRGWGGGWVGAGQGVGTHWAPGSPWRLGWGGPGVRLDYSDLKTLRSELRFVKVWNLLTMPRRIRHMDTYIHVYIYIYVYVYAICYIYI